MKIYLWEQLMTLLVFIFFLYVMVFNILPYFNGEQQFVYLARSFLQGKTYFLTPPTGGTWADTTPYSGRRYYAAGPLPVLLLMPFVYVYDTIGSIFLQGYLQFFLVIIVFFLVFQAAKKLHYSHNDSLLLGFAFCFASAFLGVAFWPWRSFFAHVLVVLLLWGGIVEYLTRRRYLVIGLFLGMAAATRLTSLLGVLFFVLMIAFGERKRVLDKAKQIVLLALPILLSLAVLGMYNYINFQNVFDFGFKNIIHPFPSFAQAASYGMFSLKHLPTNLYYFLISTPLPVTSTITAYTLIPPFLKANQWGMSILVTSPYLLYLFLLKLGDKESRALLVTVFLTAIPLLLLYTPGFRQFGYRYSLDFFPFLFFLLIKNYRIQFGDLSKKFKILIIFTAFSNLWLFTTLFI